MRNTIEKIYAASGSIVDAMMAVQEEQGWVSKDVIRTVAEVFGREPAEVYEAASFYTYINLEPVGKYVIRCCMSAPCHASGAENVAAWISNELGIGFGETTDDGLFTLKKGECVGRCDESPVMTINRKVYGKLTEESVREILASYR